MASKRKTEALKPNYFADFRRIPSLKTRELVEKGEADPEEAILHSLAGHGGWALLKNYIQQVKDDLDSIIWSQMEQGANFESIGQKTVTVQLCKEVLTKIINKVEDARESVDERINAGGKRKRSPEL